MFQLRQELLKSYEQLAKANDDRLKAREEAVKAREEAVKVMYNSLKERLEVDTSSSETSRHQAIPKISSLYHGGHRLNP